MAMTMYLMAMPSEKAFIEYSYLILEEGIAKAVEEKSSNEYSLF